MQPNPWKPMTQGNQNSHTVTLGGQTRTITGATGANDAANKAFGSAGNQATVTQTQTKK